MGIDLLTLTDIWPDNPRAMIVGLNPSPVSVAAGHYYQGRSGQRQLRRLVEASVIGPPHGSTFEEAALAAGIGFTDIVKRPTRGERGVSATEIEHGRASLQEKLAVATIPAVICVFRHPAKALTVTAAWRVDTTKVLADRHEDDRSLAHAATRPIDLSHRAQSLGTGWIRLPGSGL